MDNLNNKSKNKVMLYCPNEHNLFPDGISCKTLYNSFAVRVSVDQEIMKTDAGLKKFKLSDAQFKLLKRMCKGCIKEDE